MSMYQFHKRVYLTHTPFAKAIVAGLIIGVGSIIATCADIVWLIGDIVKTGVLHSHHYLVGLGLFIGLISMIVSLYYLYISTASYLKKHFKRKVVHYDEAHTPTHCGNIESKYIIKENPYDDFYD